MLTKPEFEILRRSAAMAPLSRGEVDRLIAVCAQMLDERQRILELLGELPESWGEVKGKLNELHRLVR
jgi:hypothetical protein